MRTLRDAFGITAPVVSVRIAESLTRISNAEWQNSCLQLAFVQSTARERLPKPRAPRVGLVACPGYKIQVIQQERAEKNLLAIVQRPPGRYIKETFLLRQSGLTCSLDSTRSFRTDADKEQQVRSVKEHIFGIHIRQFCSLKGHEHLNPYKPTDSNFLGRG